MILNVIKTVQNGFKLKITQTAFCLGIGMDQLTPEYFITTFPVWKEKIGVVKAPLDKIHNRPVVTKSKQTNNYSKRVNRKSM